MVKLSDYLFVTNDWLLHGLYSTLLEVAFFKSQEMEREFFRW